MKHAYLKELQNRLLGSVTDDADVLEQFATDQSLFRATPAAVAYPQNTADVRHIVEFAADHAGAGRAIPLTARGLGGSQTGGAVGEGLQVVFAAHMNKILHLERDSVTVQPGITLQSLQQSLFTHLKYIPQLPSAGEYATVGGAVATGTAGERAVKYGPIRNAVKSLKVVLADGTVIRTGRISARELSRRKGYSTLEGELYRQVDSLLLDHEDLIKSRQISGVPNTAGYDLWSVRGRGGSFDLTPLFIGAEGTLGLITEVTLAVTSYNPRTTLVAGYFDSVLGAGEAVGRLLSLQPSAVELVDRQLLEFHHGLFPADLETVLPDELPAVVVLAEFDNPSQFTQRLRSTRAVRLMRRHGAVVRVSTDPLEQVGMWKLRRGTVATWAGHGPKKALPFMEDAAVPVEKLPQLLEKTYKLLRQHDLEPAMWGHAGIGNVRLQPRLDLGKKKDVDKLFTLNREYTELVASLGGTPSSTHGDNPLRALTLPKLYGEEFCGLLAGIKQAFDPQDIFNPGQKTGLTEESVRARLRGEFATGRVTSYVYYT
ncbi:MAG TPA: FAD-binding oxidoreductase [Candidatus Saccharimonadia bacterium]|nr:FAD-binding oxidoreductase [Candidatus Saccharimonadia bacterium]